MNYNQIDFCRRSSKINKENLIDHKIIYANKQNAFYKPENKKINFPLFPNIENITFPIKLDNAKENLDLTREKSFSLSNQADKDDMEEPKEILKDGSIKIIDEKSKDKSELKNRDFLNKKRKDEAENKNRNSNINSLPSDKIVKKIRIMILNSVLNFINLKIKKAVNGDIGKGICIKQLLPINKTTLYHSSVEYDKEFLNKKLKEIFSSISNKYTAVLNTKNQNLIDYLINLEEHGKYFKDLFELSFLDCLEHIRGTNNSELLDELPKIDDIINNEGILDEDEINIYKDVINNYELIIEKKKKRNQKKSKNIKNLFYCKLV